MAARHINHHSLRGTAKRPASTFLLAATLTTLLGFTSLATASPLHALPGTPSHTKTATPVSAPVNTPVRAVHHTKAVIKARRHVHHRKVRHWHKTYRHHLPVVDAHRYYNPHPWLPVLANPRTLQAAPSYDKEQESASNLMTLGGSTIPLLRLPAIRGQRYSDDR